MSFVAHFRALIADNFGILALFQVLIADSFGILAFLQLLIAENFVILALYTDQVPNTPPYPVVSTSLNFANFFRQLLIVPITATTLLIFFFRMKKKFALCLKRALYSYIYCRL